jgi:Phospholipase_D-nuclease N-terminal
VADPHERSGTVLVGAYSFWDGIWTLFVFFAWLMFYTWVVLLLIDNFRRSDQPGAAKAGWALFIIFFPIVGAVSYTIARPDIMSTESAYDAPTEVYAPVSSSTASEIARLNELRREGTISESEFEALKQRAIASA